MQCTNKQPVPRVLAEFVRVHSNNWEGQRWTNWFVAVAKIIEQFLSLMLTVRCWLAHTGAHAHADTHRRPGLLRTGCSLKSASNNEVLNRSHQSLSREILVSPTFLSPPTHGGEGRGLRMCFCAFASVCVCVWMQSVHVCDTVQWARQWKKDTFSACLKFTSNPLRGLHNRWK